MYRTAITTIFISLLLVACGSTDRSVDSEIDQYHPAMPRPVMIFNPEWHVIEEDGKVYVASEYADFMDFMIYQEDLGRFIKQSISTMCYYRLRIKDDICQNGTLQAD